MSDTYQQLEQRVTVLEAELHQLKAKVGQDDRPWWEKIAGRHEGDEAFAEIARLGREIREAERRTARRDGAIGKTKKQPKRKKRAN